MQGIDTMHFESNLEDKKKTETQNASSSGLLLYFQQSFHI